MVTQSSLPNGSTSLWVPQRQACSENTRSSRSWRPAAFEARSPCHGDGRPGNAGILPNNGELTKNKMTSKNGEQKRALSNKIGDLSTNDVPTD